MQETTLITGGGKGIGAAIAKKMAGCGRVFIVGRQEAALVETCTQIRTAGGVADYLVGNIADPQAAIDAFDEINKKQCFVRNLVLNAGVGYGGATEKYEHRKFTETFEVNVFGSFFFARQFLPPMLENRRGYILFISSIAGIAGAKREVAYAGAKGAQVMMALSLAKEFARHGIISIPICPDFVESEMTERVIRGLLEHRLPKITREQAEEIVRNATRQKRILPAEEVAGIVAAICQGELDAFNGRPFLWVEELGGQT